MSTKSRRRRRTAERVPGRVGGHRERRSRAAGRGTARPRLRRPTAMPTPMPVKAVKSGCANGLKRQRTTNSAGRRAEAAGPGAVAAVVGRGEVEDVLGEREADADHAGVHDPVEDAVELGAAQPQQQQDEQPLGGLLGDRRDDRGRPVVGVPSTNWSMRLQHAARPRSRRTRPSSRPSTQQPHGLGLVAVQPQEARDQRPDRAAPPARRRAPAAPGAPDEHAGPGTSRAAPSEHQRPSPRR